MIINIQNNKNITIVGCGPGHKSFVTQIGLEKIADAEIIIGSKRLLSIFPDAKARQIILGRDYNALAQDIIKLALECSKIVILVSGDPGFFSLAKILTKKIGLNSCNVIPGISSVQLAFARIGESWSDAQFRTLHGRAGELNNLKQTIKEHNKVAVLTDDTNTPARIADTLLQNNITNRTAYVFENLSSDNESIQKFSIESLSKADIKGMNIVIFMVATQVDRLKAESCR